jgi:Cof subfamily protein (haloacid dehalogenase superfamily)
MEPVYRGIEIAAATAARALGTNITYQGMDNIPVAGGAVIAMNHISYIDYLPAGLATRQRRRRIRYMLKAEALEHGAVDFIIRHTDCIPVDRKAGAGAYAEAVRRLRRGQLVGVFPEATISRSFELKEFKTGAVRMALEAEVPIIPLILWGSHRMWTKDHPKSLGRKKIPWVIRAGEPLAPHDRAPARGARAVPAPGRRLVGSPPAGWDRSHPGRSETARRSRTGRTRPPLGGAPLMLPALVATDVDGTLLDPDERITPRTRAAVAAAVAGGVQFVLATGRPPRWIPPVVDALGFAPMAVCANGAVIYDAASDRVISARTLPVDVLTELAEIAARVVPGVGLAAERIGRSAHDSATPQFVSAPGYEHAWLNPDNTEVSHEDLLSAPAVKLLVRKPGISSSELAAALARHIGVLGDITYSTNDGLIEISPIGITKAVGVAEVARPLQISAEDVVAFGDMPNDVPMLRWAGHGVAMGNAHPDAIAAANEVTAPNSDDGLARVLERWWL